MLETSIKSLPRTKPVTIRRFESIGIKTYEDLLEYFPHRYEDFSITSPIKSLQIGETVTVKGTIEDIKTVYPRRHLTIQKAHITDGTGSLEVIWYNQRFIPATIHPKDSISVSGQVKKFKNTLTLEAKAFEKLSFGDQTPIHTARLTPLYSEKKGLSSRVIREKVHYVLEASGDKIPEILPPEMQRKNNHISRRAAVFQIHFPRSLSEAHKARERLAFDELFILQLAARRVRELWKKERVGHTLRVAPHKKKLDEFIRKLPFDLTKAQKRVCSEIMHDLGLSTPMNRFLQGEVGSGKTVVAAMASYITFLNGYKTLFMAPTEILAQQHYETLSQLLTPMGVKITLLTGSTKKQGAGRTSGANNLRTTSHKLPTTDVIVGTHALLYAKNGFKKVGFIVIDEQHRFGVRQRALLQQTNIHPHLLTMTATPIPRTVALTLYGQLDVSIIDEMPKKRLPVKTYLVPPYKRGAAYEWMREKIAVGEQAFIVCPLIEESERETMKTVKAAAHEFEHLSKEVFSEFRMRLIHGRVKSGEKQEIMEAFKQHDFDILVSTPVVEVGIDIAGATIMVIEAGERYGLAQLHQLRGRVGRGEKESYCLLFSESDSASVKKRLSFFSKNSSGIELAEYDLKRRGAGELYGHRQHGFQLLKIADPTDFEFVSRVNSAVSEFLNSYAVKDFPALSDKVSRLDLEFISPN